MLKAQGRGDVFVRDRTEHLVLCAYLETNHHCLVVDELRQLLGLVAVLGLPLHDGLAEPPRLRLRALSCNDRQSPRDEVVAAVAVRHLLHVPTLTVRPELVYNHASPPASS